MTAWTETLYAWAGGLCLGVSGRILVGIAFQDWWPRWTTHRHI